MTQKTHWPFGGDPWGQGGKAASRQQDDAGGKMRSADQTAMRNHSRNDRLIVGGRAHTKKSGLS